MLADADEVAVIYLLAEMVKKRPMLENLLRPFAVLFIEKARLATALKAELNPAQLPISLKQLSEGVPILAEISFDSLKPALDRAFAALAPVLKAAFPALARELNALPHLDTMSVGLAHLDMLAQEKGFNPMVRTPWNTFE